MNIYFKLDDDAYKPERAYPNDAGLDLRARESAKIPPFGSFDFDTGVHVKLEDGTCGMLVSKSGLLFKKGLSSTGLVDAGYRGTIHVKLFNHTDKWRYIKKGDKISQLIIFPILTPDVFVVDLFDENTERGDNGFGSSGR